MERLKGKDEAEAVRAGADYWYPSIAAAFFFWRQV
jgi:hypothetical protein